MNILFTVNKKLENFFFLSLNFCNLLVIVASSSFGYPLYFESFAKYWFYSSNRKQDPFGCFYDYRVEQYNAKFHIF